MTEELDAGKKGNSGLPAPKGTWVMTVDQLKFLGEVGDWLGSVPSSNLNYGDFYVSAVQVSFEDERIGTFLPEDDSYWMYHSQ